MPWGAIASAVAPSIIGGLMGGGQQSYQQPQFTMPNQQGVANQYQGAMNQYYGGMMPYAQQTFQQQYNNPYAGGMQNAAGMAGQASQGYGNQAYGQMQNLGMGGNAVMNTAFDPQNQLYNAMQQQNTDQTNAGLSQRGLGTSPYGAGVANESNQTFNMDWQNAQLGRQTQGLQAAGQAYQGAGGQGQQAVGAYGQAGALPFGAYNQIGQGQNTAMQNYYGNVNPYMNTMQSYLGLGQQGTQNANNAIGMQNAQNNQSAYGYGNMIQSGMNAYNNSQPYYSSGNNISPTQATGMANNAYMGNLTGNTLNYGGT